MKATKKRSKTPLNRRTVKGATKRPSPRPKPRKKGRFERIPPSPGTPEEGVMALRRLAGDPKTASLFSLARVAWTSSDMKVAAKVYTRRAWRVAKRYLTGDPEQDDAIRAQFESDLIAKLEEFIKNRDGLTVEKIKGWYSFIYDIADSLSYATFTPGWEPGEEGEDDEPN